MSMTPPDKPVAAERVRQNLVRAQNVRAEADADPVQAKRRRRLKIWQVERLTRTYADMVSHPRHGPPSEFFRTDLYGPKEVSQRDRDIERVYPTMVRLLPASALDVVATAFEVDALSEELDHDLAVILWEELKCEDQINDAIYAEGYRRSGKKTERERQIALVLRLGWDLDKLIRTPFLYTSLKLMRAPAKMAGLGELQSFLERGFTAFRGMGGADEFLAIIKKRETIILEKIFAGDPHPFEVAP
jgi:hypothetical protein